MANYLLRRPCGATTRRAHAQAPRAGAHPRTFQQGFEARFARVRDGYGTMLQLALDRRGTVLRRAFSCSRLRPSAAPFLGQNFFPSIDSGQIACMFASAGTRIEETSRSSVWSTAGAAGHAERPDRQYRRQLRPALQRHQHGLPQQRDIGLAGRRHVCHLKEGQTRRPSTVKILRKGCRKGFPGRHSPSCRPTSAQILNFGLPAPIDIQVGRRRSRPDLCLRGQMLAARQRRSRHRRRAHPAGRINYPRLDVEVDRTLATEDRA